jgi:hypothetical protein
MRQEAVNIGVCEVGHRREAHKESFLNVLSIIARRNSRSNCGAVPLHYTEGACA